MTLGSLGFRSRWRLDPLGSKTAWSAIMMCNDIGIPLYGWRRSTATIDCIHIKIWYPSSRCNLECAQTLPNLIAI